MLKKYVTIFRAVNNFVFEGDDGRTPAIQELRHEIRVVGRKKCRPRATLASAFAITPLNTPNFTLKNDVFLPYNNIRKL